VLAYDPDADVWSEAAPLNVGKSQSAVALMGSTIVAAGGLTNSDATTDNEGYDAVNNVWTTLAPLPTARQAGCFGTVADTLYFAGGHGVGNGSLLDTMDAYDADANSWTTGFSPMPNAVVNSGSAIVGGLLYCFGGSDAGDPFQGNIFDYVQIYQPALEAPSTGGVVSASAFGEFPYASPGSWIEIYGSDLASDTRSWQGSDFNGNNAPTSLDGTSVTIGGEPLFIDFISPGQVNALIPSDVPTGVQQIVVTTAGVAGDPFNITINPVAPGLLAPPSFSVSGIQYAVALFADGTYVLPTGAISGLNSQPAEPGDEIVLYGVGFGPVTPGIPAGQLVGEANNLASDFQISIDGVPCQVLYDGLAPNYTGLYQFNITVPNVPPGNAVPLTFTVAGVNGTQTLYIAVGN
jgi:uncharacterized protein (TIGR03437 family)